MMTTEPDYPQIITPFAWGDVTNLPESAWLGHLPFARWLVEVIRPQTIVELGTHRGASFLAFCQAVCEMGLTSAVHAVDTWEGDAHAGFYDDDIYQSVLERMTDRLASVGHLHRKTFDEARSGFGDKSVDILHIDGLHTYEAVRHDFELWEATVKDGGVVLFHDTAELKEDFGVWKLWDELKSERPSFEFLHSHGLGVMGIGSEFPGSLKKLFSADAKEKEAIRKQFEISGQRFQLIQANQMQQRQIELLNMEIADLKASKSWTITKPLRKIDSLLKRIGA
ncbi:MAG: class I SAM-dependent methyltransferase [Thalassococcus sp.]|nr:class I SAM-dependent methyltransferase [Thalassococcus sp.]